MEIMKILPPIHGPRSSANAVKTQGGSTQNSAVVKSLPPIRGSSTNASQTGQLTNSVSRRRSTKTVERVFLKVERHRKSKPSVLAETVTVAESTLKVPEAISQETVSESSPQMVEVVTQESASLRHKMNPDGLDMALPNGQERSVLLLKGHALALLRMLELRSPINFAFLPSIMGAFVAATKRVGAVSGGTTEISVLLTIEQISSLVGNINRGRGSLASAESAPILDAFRRAIALDESYAIARAERRTKSISNTTNT